MQGIDLLYFVLLLLGFICFIVGAWWTAEGIAGRYRGPRSLISLGLAFWILVPLIQLVRK